MTLRRPRLVAACALAAGLAAGLGGALGCAGQEPAAPSAPEPGREPAVEEGESAPATAAADGITAAEGAPAGEPTAAPADDREGGEAAAVRRLRVEVLETLPHDTGAFTQGLLLEAPGTLLESTGQYGSSELRRVDLESGEVMRRRPLADHFFGEGLARVPAAAFGGDGGDRLVQLTWRAGVALLWDAASFDRLGEHAYPGEGWGLCWLAGSDGAEGRLVMSDGSDRLTFRDPRTFAELGEIRATIEDRPLGGLNELECVDGRVWANVYGRAALVEIDPADGRVLSLIDASGLLGGDEQARADVLNGIAYDPADGSFLLTGKLWPKLFRVRFVPVEAAGEGGEP